MPTVSPEAERLAEVVGVWIVKTEVLTTELEVPDPAEIVPLTVNLTVDLSKVRLASAPNAPESLNSI